LVVGALVVGAVGPGSAEVVSDCFAVADAVGDWVRSGVGGGLGVGDGVGGGCAQRAAAAFSCSTVTRAPSRLETSMPVATWAW
jgi:hypothetical protein